LDTGEASTEWTQVESSLLDEMKDHGLDIANQSPEIFMICPKCVAQDKWLHDE
jgi:hypothetical protein